MDADFQLQDLKHFTTCDIGDALVKLNYPFGGFLDGLTMYSPSERETRIYGRAVTVKMVEMNSSGPKPSVHFADCNKAGHIMYIQQPKGMNSACWGGLMSTRANKVGGCGVIVDGRIRDIQEHKDLNFPVFARSTSILGSGSFTRASEINVSLQYKEELWVHPGDILVGDQDGVVVVPQSLVAQVVALCQERADVDKKIIAALQSGREMGEAIQLLRK
ncbi:unnamed protein product [Penicillium salamii]|uniref:RraA-like protein n=1 Tax=Penicillium salamii TaxID=1612424 RepID=A0A9W4IP72_9EURO|nr:unnamed protein product [Penicillium salamii]CAG8118388.1 unnamed protein product [Penicillium salamii]CAG8294214.1 unnamed protein product [Penicillium salamii]CAG8345555.1 unnamed protein product [Penicillium salamii]CAG8347557.1 unnamed protein product [Penicillium salamii]